MVIDCIPADIVSKGLKPPQPSQALLMVCGTKLLYCEDLSPFFEQLVKLAQSLSRYRDQTSRVVCKDF